MLPRRRASTIVRWSHAPREPDIRLSVKRRSWAQGSRLAKQVKATSSIRAAVLAAKTGASGNGAKTRLRLVGGGGRNCASLGTREYAASPSPQARKVPHKRPQAPETSGISAPASGRRGGISAPEFSQTRVFLHRGERWKFDGVKGLTPAALSDSNPGRVEARCGSEGSLVSDLVLVKIQSQASICVNDHLTTGRQVRLHAQRILDPPHVSGIRGVLPEK